MTETRWDDCCPHCEEKIHSEIYEEFAGDYANEFEMDCPKCGKRVNVLVHPVPEFELSKAN